MPPENLRFSKGTEVLIPRVGEDPMDYNHCTWLSMPDVAIGEMISVFNTDNNPLFTATMFNATLQNEFAMRVEGGSVTNLYFEKLKNIEVSFPSIQEQEKIAAYFENLDHLITLHQRKCEETKSLKKYMLQKMFPENGKCVPEIRFSGFSDAWEQRKFGEIVEKYEDLVETPTEGYTRLGIRSHAKGTFHSFVEKGKELETAKMFRVAADKFIVNITFGWEHAVAITDENDAGKLVSHRFPQYSFNAGMVPKFFRYLILDENFKHHLELSSPGGAGRNRVLKLNDMLEYKMNFPSEVEQGKIAAYFDHLDHLITLHQRKCYRFIDIALDAWEQRKVSELLQERNEQAPMSEEYPLMAFIANQGVAPKGDRYDRSALVNDETGKKYKRTEFGDFIYSSNNLETGSIGLNKYGNACISPVYSIFKPTGKADLDFLGRRFLRKDFINEMVKWRQGVVYGQWKIHETDFLNIVVTVPTIEEQKRIGDFLDGLDSLITLHQHKLFCAKNVMKYITTDINTPKKEAIMAELESVIEQKLIEQLIYGDSQWTYREDLKTEADLWKNFRYILEQNNKERLNGEPLSDAEFEQVKNQLQFSSFYKAGEWLVGENGKVMVHVQRDTERLHLVVMNHEHIAGGSSVYEVINQYNALKMDEDSSVNARDRRFDVTLMINGLPMIHIELKNKQHSYMDGFWQIKKYIGEGKFTGIFSAVQMFVISNGGDTKYFSAASDTELNPKFISGWLDKENNAVSDYLDFAKSVLRIPEAHEMIARYTVLDEEAKRLILLRPYQIHAIEAIRDASKTGKSGFVWHTTGSGKTLTSYKATRNLLMDIPAIDKAIFLIDRKDLDTQTTMAFQAYANNDLIDVDETDNVFDLKKKLKSDDRQVIVTTIQKLQRLITRKLQEGTPEYNKIKNLKIAFVVDE